MALGFHHPADQLVARQIIFSVEMMGRRFSLTQQPAGIMTIKIGQKYLLESVGAALIPTHVFFNEHEAMLWIEKKNSKVFKLRCGAGSQNVQLVRTKKKQKNFAKKRLLRIYGLWEVILPIARTKSKK